jgi:hypothetical protein
MGDGKLQQAGEMVDVLVEVGHMIGRFCGLPYGLRRCICSGYGFGDGDRRIWYGARDGLDLSDRDRFIVFIVIEEDQMCEVDLVAFDRQLDKDFDGDGVDAAKLENGLKFDVLDAATLDIVDGIVCEAAFARG